MGKDRSNFNYNFIIIPFPTDNVILWCVRVTIVAVARQQCISCVLLKYTSLSTV